jgi:hypothetical protein
MKASNKVTCIVCNKEFHSRGLHSHIAFSGHSQTKTDTVVTQSDIVPHSQQDKVVKKSETVVTSPAPVEIGFKRHAFRRNS